VGCRKHGRKPRQWRKSQLAVDTETGEIVARRLTDKYAGDITQVSALVATVEGRIASVIADGAYDGEMVYQETVARQHDPPAEVVIPPRSSSVVTAGAECQTIRDRHIQLIVENGRMAWQKTTSYSRRSLVEAAIGRYRHIIGSTLRARSNDGQGGEVAIAVHVFNRMIRIAPGLAGAAERAMVA
jgi:transposase